MFSHANTARGRSFSAPQFWVPFYLCIRFLRRTTKFDVIWGGGCFRGSTVPPSQGVGSQRFPVLGSPFYLCIYPLTQNFQICRGEGTYFQGSTIPHTKRAGFIAPQFWEFLSIFAYTVCCRTTKLTW